jgi:hypothetical protein
MKVNLWFESKQRLLSSNVQDEILKVFCNISLLEEDKSWSPIWNAILDTGAHTTLIPKYIWEKLYYESLSESLFLGIKSNLLCSVPCKVARVMGVILDEEGHNTEPFIMNAYLAKSNDVPLIMGVSTAMDRFQLNIDYPNRKGFLDDGN